MGETRARSHGEKLQRAEEEGRTLQGRQVQGAEGQPWGRGELAGEIAMAAGLASCARLLRVGQGAGGVEEAGAEEEGLLLARKRSRGTCAHGAGRGAEGGACCSPEGGADHGEERSRAPCCWLLLP
jgi:hypothetical protein